MLLWLGAAASLGLLAVGSTLYGLLPWSLSCMVMGGLLLFAGAKWARSENWPTHGD